MAEGKWIQVAREEEVPEGGLVKVTMEDEEVLLTRIQGRFLAWGNRCPHHGAPLDEGLAVGGEVVCPWHHARFDRYTGKATRAPALDDLPRYPVKVAAGKIHLDPAQPPPEKERGLHRDQTFVVVGAGAAGNAAAETLRREGFAGRLVLITAEKEPPYDRTALSKGYLTGDVPPGWVPLRDAAFYRRLDIELWTGRRVVSVDPKERLLVFHQGDPLRYDQALLATGGRPRLPGVPGEDLEHIFMLRSFDSARSLLDAAQGAEKAVVAGASFIGMEVAAALCTRGLEVRVVAPESVPLEGVFGERIGRWLQGLHEQHGVRFHLGRSVQAFAGKNGRVRTVELSDGTTLDADLVVAGLGIVPQVSYVQGTGLLEGEAVPVNPRLQTREDFLYAAGDIALVPDPRTDERRRVEHWVEAERQGQHAACSMLGVEAPYREVPFFWTMQYGQPIHYAGYAPHADRIAYRGQVEQGDFLAGYYQDGRLLAVAGAGRPREMIAAEQLIRTGTGPGPESFARPGTDLVDMITHTDKGGNQ